jgi:hypothetical protein
MSILCSPRPLVSLLSLAGALALSPAASAAPKQVPPAPAAAKPAPPPDPADQATPPEEDAETVQELNDKIRQLEARLDQTQAMMVQQRPRVTIGGYADFGFFVPQGNGSGIIRDNGNVLFPQSQGRYGWVFLGDILAPTVNSRGEVADLDEPTGVLRFDSIHSGGAPGFILNEVNLTLGAGFSDDLVGSTSINFVPRSGSNFALGDFVDVDLAQFEWMPTKSHRDSFFIGKIEPVFGIEYRERKANTRFGITPSLMGRYTMGTALGLKWRSKFGPSNNVVLAVALTNGSTTTEQFHFYDEIDRNAGKTGSARLALRLPPSRLFELEIGGSGEYGPQDRATNSRHPMWFVGVDMLARISSLDIKAQWMKGGSDGWPPDQVFGLKLHNGGYLELNWMLTPVIGLLGRGEFRDAFVWLGDPTSDPGANRAYLTKSWRATGGVRIVFSERVVLKAEYLHNGEYGGIPQIPNDVFTSSIVFMN